MFLRFADHLELTGTFKQRKTDLVRDGFDPAKVTDPLYVMAADTKAFTALDGRGFAAIAAGRLRV